MSAVEGAVQLLCNAEENVIIQKVGNLDPSHWDELVRWWSDGSYVSNDANEIIVDLETFILKRGWFKDNWRAKSRTVDLSPDLRAIIDEGKKMTYELPVIDEQSFEAIGGGCVMVGNSPTISR